MKTYTALETAAFKAQRNEKSKADKQVAKSVWYQQVSGNKFTGIVTNSFSRLRMRFNSATRSLIPVK